jgi:hypothetical protein
MDGGRLAQRALSQAREQLRLVVPRGEVECRVEPAAQFCERVVVAGDRIRGAGLKAGGQVRRFGDGGCLRSPMRQRLQSQHSKAAGCAMDEDFLSPGVLTRDPGPAAVSHIVTKL